MKLLATWMALVPVVATVVATPTDAHACGGCFVPPEENSVVTGHRMILSVGMTQSTLYDQIEYSGNPEEFAWVLPIVGTVDIGVSSDLIFNQLGFDTAVSVAPPVLQCPPIHCRGWDDDFAGGGANSPEDGLSSGSGGAGEGGVDVLAEEVVGPYETVQLAADDPNALNAWLDEHGYNVPAEIQPIIDSYVEDGFNFLAMKLVPGVGVERMAPVRITTPGSNAVLPLRMVAAGTGATTTISLWLMGEGRYEPANFPGFTIAADDVIWDYDTSDSNYNTLRAEGYAASDGHAWLTEASFPYSADVFRSNILNVVSSLPDQSGYDDGSGDWQAAYDRAVEDLDALFGGIDTAHAHVTRLRAELSRPALGSDLIVTASDDQADVPSFIQTVTFVGTQPPCPEPPEGCYYYGLNDGEGSDNGGGCAVTESPSAGGTAAAGLFLYALGVVVLRRRRRG
jgi:MYXO-CTERM domain-containing protein